MEAWEGGGIGLGLSFVVFMLEVAKGSQRDAYGRRDLQIVVTGRERREEE